MTGVTEYPWHLASLPCEDGWQVVYHYKQEGSDNLSCFEASWKKFNSAVILRWQACADVPIGSVIDRFDRYYSGSTNECELPPGIAGMEFLDDVAPGDHLFRINYQQKYLEDNSIWFWQLREHLGANMRLIIRQHFPQENQYTVLWGPVDNGTSEIMVAEPCPKDPENKTVLNNLLEMPEKFTARISKWCCSATAELNYQEFAAWMNWLSQPAFRKTDCSAVVLVAMKNSSRNSPLSLTAEGKWVSNSTKMDNFCLAEYLHHLLQASHVHDLPVWSTLYGWTLVPYQAVILRKHWDCFIQLMEPIWGSMRTAYRYVHGGSRAPKLCVVEKESRVRSCWKKEHSPQRYESILPRISYTVTKTFVDIESSDDEFVDVRAASMPPRWVEL